MRIDQGISMFFNSNWQFGFILIGLVALLLLIKWGIERKNRKHLTLKDQTSNNNLSFDSWSEKFRRGLDKTHRATWGAIFQLLSSPLDEVQMEKLEELFLSSDLSVEFVENFLVRLRQETDRGVEAIVAAKTLLKKYFMEVEISKKLNQFLEIWKANKDHSQTTDPKQNVVLLAGINGAGKTTTLGKIAYKLAQIKKSVLLAAGDTFRAAAVSQLSIWAERASVGIITPKEGEESAALAYRAIAQGMRDQHHWCLIDTAGRLHQQEQLMQELKKCYQVVSRQVAPEHLYCFLVVDAMQGKAVLRQAESFNQVLPLDGIIVTKCDGSAKAGMLLEIVAQLAVPIILCGVGEELEDLNTFDPELFIETLLA